MYKRSFIKLGEIIPRLVVRHGNSSALQAAWILRLWPEVRVAVFGNKTDLKKIKALTLKNSVLTIESPSSLWANELRLKSTVILKEFNKKLGKSKITKLHFKLAG